MTVQNPWADEPQDGVPEQAQQVWGDEAAIVTPPLARLDRLDFRDAIAQNKRNTFYLMFFMLCLAGGFGYVLGWAWDVTFGGTLTAGLQYMTNQEIDWKALLFTPSPSGLKLGGILLAVMLLWSGFTLLRADKIVLSMAGAREVTHAELPQLHNVVEEIAIAAGLPMPRIYLVPTRMPNAFATGLRSDKAVVGITTGLLEQLNRRELQGVMAHEMGHVLNDDMRYATIMAVMTGILIFIAEGILHSQRFFAYGGYNNGRRERNSNGFVMIIMIIVFLITAILVPILARIIQMAISRQREYLADATAVRLTRDPGGLIAALQKIAASEEPAPRVNSAIEPLLFMAPEQMLHNGNRQWFSTHPSVESRIQRLKALE